MQDLATRLTHLAPRPGNGEPMIADPPLTVALRRPVGLPAGRTAAGRHARGVRRRRDPPQRRTASGRPGPRSAVVGEPSQAPNATSWPSKIDSAHGRSSDAALAAMLQAVRRAGRRGGHEPGARAGPGGDARRRAARRQRPLPARRLPRRPGGAPARHPGRPQRAVECRRGGDPDAGPADHRHLGARAASGTRCCSTGVPTARRTRSPRSAMPPPCRPPWPPLPW